MGFGTTASIILRVSLIITIVVACLIVLAALFTLLTGMVGIGVRTGHSNVFRSVTKGELAVALFAVLALGVVVAVFVLRRL